MGNKEYRNSSQETANCDKQLYKMLKMNTEVKRRHIATQAMSAMLSNRFYAQQFSFDAIAELAVKAADALIVRLNK